MCLSNISLKLLKLLEIKDYIIQEKLRDLKEFYSFNAL